METCKLFHKFRDLVKVFFVIAPFYILLERAGITCPFLFLTGISCAGCGMSRAWFSLLFQMDISMAFFYHPLFWLPIPIVLIYIIKYRIPKAVYRATIFGCCVVFLVVYALRMLSPDNSIVRCTPEQGIIYNVVAFIAEMLRTKLRF